MNETDTQMLRKLLDRQEILDCLTRYCRGVDRLDKSILLSAYHPDARDDHGLFVGHATEFWELVQASPCNSATKIHRECVLPSTRSRKTRRTNVVGTMFPTCDRCAYCANPVARKRRPGSYTFLMQRRKAANN